MSTMFQRQRSRRQGGDQVVYKKSGKPEPAAYWSFLASTLAFAVKAVATRVAGDDAFDDEPSEVDDESKAMFGRAQRLGAHIHAQFDLLTAEVKTAAFTRQTEALQDLLERLDENKPGDDDFDEFDLEDLGREFKSWAGHMKAALHKVHQGHEAEDPAHLRQLLSSVRRAACEQALARQPRRDSSAGGGSPVDLAEAEHAKFLVEMHWLSLSDEIDKQPAIPFIGYAAILCLVGTVQFADVVVRHAKSLDWGDDHERRDKFLEALQGPGLDPEDEDGY